MYKHIYQQFVILYLSNEYLRHFRQIIGKTFEIYFNLLTDLKFLIYLYEQWMNHDKLIFDLEMISDELISTS